MSSVPDRCRIAPDPLQLHHPATARIWLLEPGSMTRAIAARFGTRPAVRPTREGPAMASPWERALLGIDDPRVHLREVVLTIRGTPVLWARSVTPLADPAARSLRRLQTTPLAELLFRDPRWRRAGPIAAVTARETRERHQRWPGRTCLWQRGRSRLIVSEFFLPTLLAATDNVRHIE